MMVKRKGRNAASQETFNKGVVGDTGLVPATSTTWSISLDRASISSAGRQRPDRVKLLASLATLGALACAILAPIQSAVAGRSDLGEGEEVLAD